jgi:2-methylcitrate dehydratase PrpD
MRDGSARALAIAIDNAEDAMEAVVEVMRNPERNSATKLAACKLILDYAGVSIAEADKRHEELLTMLKSRLGEDAYAEVVRALAAHQRATRAGNGKTREQLNS